MEQKPLAGDITPLKGPHQGSYRRRVGAFRIIFTVDPKDAVIAVADIARRTSTTY